MVLGAVFVGFLVLMGELFGFSILIGPLVGVGIFELYRPCHGRTLLDLAARAPLPHRMSTWRECLTMSPRAPVHRVQHLDGSQFEVALLDKRAQRMWPTLNLPTID